MGNELKKSDLPSQLKRPRKIRASYKPVTTDDRLKQKLGWLKRKYNLSHEEYLDLFKQQNHKCAICGIHQSTLKDILHVDHDHVTGKVRGLLCKTCNTGLGAFKDNIDSLNEAIRYLKR